MNDLESPTTQADDPEALNQSPRVDDLQTRLASRLHQAIQDVRAHSYSLATEHGQVNRRTRLEDMQKMSVRALQSFLAKLGKPID